MFAASNKGFHFEIQGYLYNHTEYETTTIPTGSWVPGDGDGLGHSMLPAVE